MAEDFIQAWDAAAWMQLAIFPNVSAGYRPLMFAFWYVGSLLWGYQPAAYRLVVIALHALNACLVAAITLRLARRRDVSLLAGLLFSGLAPSVATVNWLSAASNLVLCGLGYLAALWLYLGLRQDDVAPGRGAPAGAPRQVRCRHRLSAGRAAQQRARAALAGGGGRVGVREPAARCGGRAAARRVAAAA
jgi:hypothetical protein